MRTAELGQLCYMHYQTCTNPVYKIQFGEILKTIIDLEREELEKNANGPFVPKTKK